VAENLLLYVRDEINKQKHVPETNFGNMAETKIGCVNHDCDKCKAVQEPVAQDVQEKCRIETVPAKGGLLPTPPAPQPAPVKTYSDGKPWPVAPKPWVGLTDEEITLAMMRVEEQGSGYFLRLARAIEAKLREKNGGAA
jgi:hypothetical protein